MTAERILGIVGKLAGALLVIGLLVNWQAVSKMENRIFLLCRGNVKCESEGWAAVLDNTCADVSAIDCEIYKIMASMQGVKLRRPAAKQRLNARPPDTLANEVADIEKMIVLTCLSTERADNPAGFLSCENRLWKEAVKDICAESPRRCQEYRHAAEKWRKRGAF